MELWIRTQSEGIHQIIGINAPYVQKDCVSLVGYNHYKYIELGVYKTEQRALEILDEIQDILIPKYLIRTDGNTQEVADFLNTGASYITAENNADVRNIDGSFVYIMPKE